MNIYRIVFLLNVMMIPNARLFSVYDTEKLEISQVNGSSLIKANNNSTGNNSTDSFNKTRDDMYPLVMIIWIILMVAMILVYKVYYQKSKSEDPETRNINNMKEDSGAI